MYLQILNSPLYIRSSYPDGQGAGSQDGSKYWLTE